MSHDHHNHGPPPTISTTPNPAGIMDDHSGHSGHSSDMEANEGGHHNMMMHVRIKIVLSDY